MLCEARRRSEPARSVEPRSTAPRDAGSTTTEKFRARSPTSGGPQAIPPPPAPWLTRILSLARPSRTRQEKRCEKSRRSLSNSEVTRTGGRWRRSGGLGSSSSGGETGSGVAGTGGAAPSPSIGGGGGRSAGAAMRCGEVDKRDGGGVARGRSEVDTWRPLHVQRRMRWNFVDLFFFLFEFFFFSLRLHHTGRIRGFRLAAVNFA